jgi:Nif-specific regulatory protein
VLPPLRERKEDIPALVQYFIQRFSAESKKTFSDISEQALRKIIAYDWPGNVRELANAIERAVVLGQPPTIQLDDLPGGIFASEANSAAGTFSYHNTVDEYRREVILKALAEARGNRTAAAKLLGLERSYLQKLLKSFDIP